VGVEISSVVEICEEDVVWDCSRGNGVLVNRRK
jgi:hypothetical protein